MLRYRLLLAGLSPLVWAWFWWRGRREPAYRQRWHERLGRVDVVPEADIWIHGASLGELHAAKPLIEACLMHGRVLVTSFTPAGSAYVQQTFADRVDHCYLPLDWYGAVLRFLQRARPQRAIILETELWPELLTQCHKQQIAVDLVSARLSASTLKRYQQLLGRATCQKLVSPVQHIGAQTETDRQHFIGLGADVAAVSVTGNIKLDMHLPESFAEQRAALQAAIGQRPVLLAASTHAGEEQAALALFEALRRQWPNLLLLIAPRHPQRFDAVARLLSADKKVARRSQGQAITVDTEIYLVDTLGELLWFYGVADVAFVGGSLSPVGGHNVLEPMLTETAVVVGPHLHAQPIAQALVVSGHILQGDDVSALQAHCQKLFADPAYRMQQVRQASQFLQASQGALPRSLALLGLS